MTAAPAQGARLPQSSAFKPGDFIIREGAMISGFYVIQSGKVRLVRESIQEKSAFDVLGAGDFFGESFLVGTLPSPYSAEAISAVHVLEIDGELLEQLIAQHDDVAVRLVQGLARRLVVHEGFSHVLVSRDLKQRVLKGLLWFCDFVRDISDNAQPSVGLNDLAGKLGLSEQTLKKVISPLEKLGFVQSTEGRILVNDVTKLREFEKLLEISDNANSEHS